MSLHKDHLKEMPGVGNSRKGGQFYTLYSETNTLEEMIRADYLDDLADTVFVRDLIVLTAIDGADLFQVESVKDGQVKVRRSHRGGGGDERIQFLRGPGAISLEHLRTELATGDGHFVTVSLADGYVDQTKTIGMVSGEATAVCTPDTMRGYKSIHFKSAGGGVRLEFIVKPDNQSGWWDVVGAWGDIELTH